MAIKNLLNKVMSYTKKYRYVVLILVIGLVLMCIPNIGQNRDKNKETAEPVLQEPTQTADMQLAEILSSIEGAGKVKVLLTVSEGERTIYQTNVNNTQVSTVVVTDAQRKQDGLVMQVISPVYLGAIVVCQGADSPKVRLAVVEAVSNVTGLGADRISVLKMK